MSLSQFLFFIFQSLFVNAMTFEVLGYFRKNGANQRPD